MSDTLRAMLARSWTVSVEQLVALLPKVVAGALILAAGLLIARLIRGLAARFFLAIRLDRLSDRAGLTAFLARGDVRHTLAETLATVTYWLVLLFSLQVLGLALGLPALAAFSGQVLGYLPRVAAAAVIVLAGIAVGAFLGGAVRAGASTGGFPAAAAAGTMVKYLIGFFALVMALEELQIATQLLIATMQIVIAAIALALALAFGLGCKDLARDAVRTWLGGPAGTREPEHPNPPESDQGASR